MNYFPKGKQKKEKHAPEILERDAPFDVEHEWEEARFAQVYLEHTNQQSNIYFEQHQRERAQQSRNGSAMPRVSPVLQHFLLWRFVSAGAFGGIMLTAVFGAAWWWNEGARIPGVHRRARGIRKYPSHSSRFCI